MSRRIPDIPSKTILGHLRAYVRDPLTFLQAQQQQHGDIFTFRVAGRRLIFINHPDYIQRVLQENHRNYKKSQAYRKLALLLGDGLFTSDGEYWQSQRRTIQPAFHRNQIKTYVQVMHDISLQMLERWNTNREIELTSEMTHVTLRIISKTMLDIDLAQEDQVVERHLPFALRYMVNHITSPLAVPVWIPTRENRQFKRAVHVLDKLIDQIIQYKKQYLNIDLLSQLITLINKETGKGLTDRQLRDEVMTIFLAGHETTAMGLIWILNYVLKDESVKEKLTKELAYIVNPWDAIENFYIQNVISEALRLFTPVWILSREAIGADMIGEYGIKRGDRIIFSPYIVHRHPDFWSQPDKFDPDRWDKPPGHRYAYFPFGGGPRVCIGQHFALMEMTILLVNILKIFPNMRRKSTEEIGFDYSITLRPDREIILEL